jgi:hypothetical protein
MKNQSITQIAGSEINRSKGQSAPSRPHKPFVILLLAVALATSLIQVGCVGLTGAAQNNPGNPFLPKTTSDPTSPALTLGPGGTFGSVAVGASASQTISITNSGTGTLTITQISISGTGYTASGYTLPISVSANQSATVTVNFAPASANTFTGSLSLTSNASPAVSTLALTGAGTQGQLVANPSAVTFTGISVGSVGSHTVTLTNSGSSSVTVSQASASGAGISMTGLTLPTQIGAGQSASFTATFTPSSGSPESGAITVANNSSTPSLVIPVSATATQSQISVTPSSLQFSNVNLGTSTSQTLTVTNTGNSTLNISNIAATGAGYSVAGFSLPVAIPAGQASNFSVTFTPLAARSLPGSVTITSNAGSSPTVVNLSGTGVQGQLTASPMSEPFGNIQVGSTSSQTVTLTNGGSTSVTISQAAASGNGFGITGISLPLTLAAGQTSTFAITFIPAGPGAVNGSVTLNSNSATPVITISTSGTGAQPAISTIPPNVTFNNVTIGLPNSQTIQIQNPGTASLTVSQANVSGAGYSISGLSLPATIAAGGSTTFNVAFAPSSTTPVSGSISLVNNSPNSPYTISLSGSGLAATHLLGASLTSLSFTNVTVGNNGTQNVTLTNNGNTPVNVSGFSISGAGFGATGVQTGTVIGVGQTATLAVTFTPANTTPVVGAAVVTSDATNSPTTIVLSGTGVQQVSHSMTLNWSASTSTVVGYNVYRSTTSGGPYTLITSSPVAGTTYTDTTVQAGVTYFYVVTAVDSSGNESAYSNEASATVPTP